GTFEIKGDRAVAPDLHLDRNVVEPVGLAERLESRLALGHVAVKRVAAIDTGNRQLPGAGELAATALLDELILHPPPIVDAHFPDGRLHALTHFDAGGDLRLLVQHPVDRHAQVSLAADDIVAADLVVLADLLGADEQAFGEPFLGKADIAARRDAARFELVADRSRPADKFALVEDRHHVHDVGNLDGADEGVIVSEDIAVANAGIGLVAFADHP